MDGVGDEQSRMMRRDAERLGHLAEPPFGDAVHEAGQQPGLLRWDRGDACFSGHTQQTRQLDDV
jgi:hypothetical protein